MSKVKNPWLGSDMDELVEFLRSRATTAYKLDPKEYRQNFTSLPSLDEVANQRALYAAPPTTKERFRMFVKQTLAGLPHSAYVPAAYVLQDDPDDLVTVRISWRQYVQLPSSFVGAVTRLETIEGKIAIFAVPRKVFDDSKVIQAIQSQYEHAVRTEDKGVPAEYRSYGSYEVEDEAGEWS